MNKHWYLSLMAFALHCSSSANFSIRFNLGLTSTGHQTKASLVETFDEIKAYETLDNFRGNDTTDESYLTKVSNKYAYVVRMQQIFVEEDKAGKPWENTTKTNYLTSMVVDSANTYVKLTDPTLLTGTDGNSTTTNFDNSLANTIVADNGLVFNLGSLTKYTTTTNTLDANWYKQYAYIVSTDSFTQMTNLKDEMLLAVETDTNHLNSQKYYNTLDGGIMLTYDFGMLNMFSCLTFHYPLDINPRTTLPLVLFSPSPSLEASLGTMIEYGKGKFGGAFGATQIRGDFLLTKYQRLTDDSNALSLQYVDYTNSYTNGNDSISIERIHDLFFYAEIRAETTPTHLGGTIIYGTYKVGFGADKSEDADLSKLDLAQDSIAVGVSFSFIDVKI